MKCIKNITVGAAIASTVIMLASCGRDKAVIDCTVEGADGAGIEVRQLVVNRYEVLDTVTTDASGRFTYKVGMKAGQPEFIYLFHNGRQIAALLLQSGEKAKVQADTLGNYTVAGSPESENLKDVDKAYAEFNARVNAILSRVESFDDDSPEVKAVQQELSREYVDYYRDRMKYVLGNPHSLTVVPVLFQTVGDGGMPVFSQQTDAIFFNNICDSLETVYPGSSYVKALRQEAERRFNNFELSRKFQQAGESGFVDIELPDVRGVRRRLSEVDAKAVLIYFWSPSVTLQKMFNIEVLKPVYDEYRDKGFEIYSVALETDKALWARVVREQQLEWLNLCDGLGTSSPVVSSYNLTKFPVFFILSDGRLTEAKFNDATQLKTLLNTYLK